MEKFIIIIISAVAAITMILLFYNSGNASKAAKELFYNQYYESKRNEVLTAMLDNRAALLRAELESKRNQLLFQNEKNDIHNCQNCGAPLNSNKCEYCGTKY